MASLGATDLPLPAGRDNGHKKYSTRVHIVKASCSSCVLRELRVRSSEFLAFALVGVRGGLHFKRGLLRQTRRRVFPRNDDAPSLKNDAEIASSSRLRRHSSQLGWLFVVGIASLDD
jgi:hypothetical protein